MSSRYLSAFLDIVDEAARQRMTLDEISQILGCSRQWVHRLYRNTGRSHWNDRYHQREPKGHCTSCGAPRYYRKRNITGLCRLCIRANRE